MHSLADKVGPIVPMKITTTGGLRPSDIASSDVDKTQVARMTAGMFGANSKLDRGSDEMLSDPGSEKLHNSHKINTSRQEARKSAKSLAAIDDDDEEEKIFNFSDKDMERLSEATSHAIERATTPGEADARFAEYFMSLELEMQAETGQLKLQNPDTVDLNYERRLLF
mmetsp:Transcript_30676/g.37964  ORF Transcript_30676/g.37964 Transcript_30676/m.37964 type:complete len:168 (+) Transcript_30676:1385-1888(+)